MEAVAAPLTFSEAKTTILLRQLWVIALESVLYLLYYCSQAQAICYATFDRRVEVPRFDTSKLTVQEAEGELRSVSRRCALPRMTEFTVRFAAELSVGFQWGSAPAIAAACACV